MKCGDIAESDEEFRILTDYVKIDEIQQPGSAITAPQAEYGFQRGVGEGCLEISGAELIAAGQESFRLRQDGKMTGSSPRSRMEFSA